MDITNDRLALHIRAMGGLIGRDPAKAQVQEVIIDRCPVIVAVKGATGDDLYKPGWERAVAQVMLRVELAGIERLGHKSGRDLDVWIGLREEALGALVARLNGMDPPFPGHRLVMQQSAPQDPWVGHITTSKDGRFRDSKWLVVRP